MKYVFVFSFLGMALLSVFAWLWQPKAEEDGRIDLVWISDDNPVRREQIELFNKLYPKYRLRLDPQNIAYGMEKTIVQCLAGVGPDLFDCYNGFQLTAYIRSGIAFVVQEGRVYGHPDNAHAPAIWYNKAIFDEAGEPYPSNDWTWDDLIPVAKRLTQYDRRGQPIRFGLMVDKFDWQSVFPAEWGASVYTPEGTRSALDSPEAAAAAQFYQDLIYREKIMPSPTEETSMASQGGWGTGTITLFGAGRAAMAVGGRWWLCILRKKDYAHLRLGAVELPRGPSRRIFGGGRATLINANSKNLEGALTFLEYMHSQSWNDLVNKQADALAPVIKYNYTKAFEFNPEHPEEDYNVVWRTALENATPLEVSPYLNGQAVDRLWLKQTDLLRENLKTGAEAMADTAQKINELIIEQLKIDPYSKKQYLEAIAKGAAPAWDRPEDEIQ